MYRLNKKILPLFSFIELSAHLFDHFLCFLSTIACKLSECLSDDELSIMAASFTALGDMLAVIAVRRDSCKDK